jgi:hypothetical protein
MACGGIPTGSEGIIGEFWTSYENIGVDRRDNQQVLTPHRYGWEGMFVDVSQDGYKGANFVL